MAAKSPTPTSSPPPVSKPTEPIQSPKPLKPLEQAFIAAYTNLDSETYNNGTQSYRSASPAIHTDAAAAVGASRLVRRDNVQRAITQVLESHGGNYEVRIRNVLDAALGRSTDRVVTEQYGADGALVGRTETERPVPHSARVAYHKILLQLAGDLDRERAVSKVETDLMARATKRLLRQAQDDADTRPGPKVVHSTATDTQEPDGNPHAPDGNGPTDSTPINSLNMYDNVDSTEADADDADGSLSTSDTVPLTDVATDADAGTTADTADLAVVGRATGREGVGGDGRPRAVNHGPSELPDVETSGVGL